MTVADSPTCVAYHFKQKYYIIAGAVKENGARYDLPYLKRYILSLVDKAKKTKTQKRIRSEIADSTSFSSLLSIVDRVIANGERTEFIGY